VQGFAKK